MICAVSVEPVTEAPLTGSIPDAGPYLAFEPRGVAAPRRCCGGVEHFLDWRNPRNGVFRKWESESDGADELSVDIDGTPAHPRNDTRMGQRPAFELCEDHVVIGPIVSQHAQDRDFERFDGAA